MEAVCLPTPTKKPQSHSRVRRQKPNVYFRLRTKIKLGCHLRDNSHFVSVLASLEIKKTLEVLNTKVCVQAPLEGVLLGSPFLPIGCVSNRTVFPALGKEVEVEKWHSLFCYTTGFHGASISSLCPTHHC